MKPLFLLSFIFLITVNVFAQDNSVKLHPVAGVRLDPVAVYSISGTDTGFVNSLSLAPVFSLRHKSGLGITYSPKFIMSALKPGLYMHELTAGIEQYDKEIVDYSFNYSHYFFTNNTSVPYSPLNNEIYGSVNYKKTWINPFFSAGIGFGNDIGETGTSMMVYDVGASAGVGHTFDWEATATSGYFRPMVSINAGTNQYFSLLNTTKYIGRNKKFNQEIKSKVTNAGISGRGNGNHSNNSASSATTEKEKFDLNNIETGIEAAVEKGGFTIRPTANIYLPVGASAGSGIISYWQMVIEYRF
jgi:hypothetical protein